MGAKSLLTAALVALSLGLVACGGSGSDSPCSSSEAETTSESEPAPSGKAAKAEKAQIVEFSKLGSATFKEPGGIFAYHCEIEIHTTMHGTVEVVE